MADDKCTVCGKAHNYYLTCRHKKYKGKLICRNCCSGADGRKCPNYTEVHGLPRCEVKG